MSKKRLSLTVVPLLVIAALFRPDLCPAQERPLRVRASAALVGGFNPTWGGYAGLDAGATLSIRDFLDISADLEGLTASVWSFGATIRPKLNFKPGFLYFDGTVFSRISPRNGNFDFVTAGSLGWKMRHLDFQAGLFSRTFGPLADRRNTLDKMESEPFNFLYRLQFNVLGDAARWDIYGGVTDFTPYEYERMWAPMFYLAGRYNINGRLSLRAEFDAKPAGMFHLTANSFGLLGRVGVKYSF